MLASLVTIAAVSAAAFFAPGLADERNPVDILAEWDIAVTSGAAPGYVPDATCALCHDDKAESFRDVGMGKSFYRPSAERIIEDFSDTHFHHLPSDRHYEMELRGDAYWFRRYRLSGDGSRVDTLEQKVDWILGSGHHSRVYLYQTADGALFQLPLAWYSQGAKWAMAPGFEWPNHPGVTRQVQRRCLFCHNAYPDVAEGSDKHALPDAFPTQLPQGIGCQRCHGPGANHARLALAGDAPLATIRAAIVQPAKLPAEKLYGICYGCHMQPSVPVPSVQRFGRNAYDFRPGQKLADFVTQIDIEASNRPQKERFEINHHPYRLEQSTCFIQSRQSTKPLGCLSCHDPHRKIPPAQRASHYRTACLSCHETDAAGLPAMKAAGSSHPAISMDADCTSCHMPERRTQDVIEVTMTDHRIVRDPATEYGSGDLTASIEKQDTDVAEVFLKDPDHGLSGTEPVIYKATAVLRHTAGRADYAADALARHLAETIEPHFEPWYELTRSLLHRRKFDEALKAVDEAELRAPGHPRLREMRALATFNKGERAQGIALLEALVRDVPDLAEQRYKLANMLRITGDTDAALAHARKALAERHNLWNAWELIGRIELERGNAQDAVAAFEKALAIEPNAPQARKGLIAALERLDRREDAARHRREGK